MNADEKASLLRRIAELEAENETFRQREKDWVRVRERELRLENHLQNLGPNFQDNIASLVKLCSELLGGASSFYYRINGDKLIPYGEKNVLTNLDPETGLIGRLCKNLLHNGSEKFFYIPSLEEIFSKERAFDDPLSGFRSFLGRVVTSGAASIGVLCVLHRNFYTPTEDDRQIMTILATVISDEDRRNEAILALRESEERFYNLAEFLPGISIQGYRKDGTVFYWNKGSKDVYGYEAAEALGRDLGDLIIPENLKPLFYDSLKSAEKIEKSGEFMPPGELVLRRKDGSPVSVYSIHTAVCSRNREVSLFCVDIDLSHQKQTETSLRQAGKELSIRNRIAQIFLSFTDDKAICDELLACILEATESPYGMYGFIDEQGAYFCPSATREVWEKCKMPDKTLVFPRESWRGIWARALEEKKTFCSNEPFVVPEGHISIRRALSVPIVDHGVVIGNIIVGNKKTDYDDHDIRLLNAIVDDLAPVLSEKIRRDFEEKRRRKAEEDRLEMERRLHHAQRLESLGVLAGGIAHDFNNLLMGIMGNLEIAQLMLTPSSKAQSYLESSLRSTLQASEITRQMLAYSGKGRFLIQEVDLDSLIKEMLPLLESSVLKTTILELDLCDHLPTISADAGQIRQVIMNLAINASEAIVAEAGTVTIRTGIMPCDDAFSRRSHLKDKPPAGRFVFLEVADTGCGMDQKTRDRLFDPFFSTKFSGRGLGMSAVLGIVRGHGGVVLVDTEPLKGTVVQVLFPLKRLSGNDGRSPMPNISASTKHLSP